jgi:hypothetical protein
MVRDTTGAEMSNIDYETLRAQISDFRKRAIRATGPGRLEYSELIDGKHVFMYAMREVDNAFLLMKVLDRIRDESQCALINKDFTKELGPSYYKCSWDMHVYGRSFGPFEEGEIDHAMTVEMQRK